MQIGYTKNAKSTLLIVLSCVTASLLCIGVIVGTTIFIYSRPIEEEASPSWSPDGQLLAYVCYVSGPTEEFPENNGYHYTEEAADVCVIGLDRRNPVRLTTESGPDQYPVWSPNGLQIAYTRHDGVYIINADGTNKHPLLPMIPNRDGTVDIGKVAWSPDGSQLLFSGCLSKDSERDIYLVNVDTGALTNLTQNNGKQDIEPIWALDGTKIVFLSSSILSGTCYSEREYGYYGLEVIDINNNDKRAIYTEESLYSYVSSNNGQIAFIANLAAKTLDERRADRPTYLYTMELNKAKSIERDLAFRSVLLWSPNGKWVVYSNKELKLFNIETEEVHTLPLTVSGNGTFIQSMTWSPDSKQVAIAISQVWGGFYSEKHIRIFNILDGSARPLIQK